MEEWSASSAFPLKHTHTTPVPRSQPNKCVLWKAAAARRAEREDEIDLQKICLYELVSKDGGCHVTVSPVLSTPFSVMKMRDRPDNGCAPSSQHSLLDAGEGI